MSNAQYRIVRERNTEWFYVERFVKGEGYPVYISTGFNTIDAAQEWLDDYRNNKVVSNFYQGEWQ